MRNLKRSLLTIVHAWADQARVAVATFGMWSRGVIQMFREAGATTPERAQPFRARSLMEKFAFKQLLPGGDRLNGSGVLCAAAHELSFNYTARGGRVARTLSAIR